MSTAPRSVEGICLAPRRLRHLHRKCRWVEPPPADELRHLHGRGYAIARWANNRVYVAQGRRSRHLHDGDRRLECAAPDEHARLRWRAVLLTKRKAHRVSGVAPQ